MHVFLTDKLWSINQLEYIMRIVYLVHTNVGYNTYKRKADAEFWLSVTRVRCPTAYIEVRDLNAIKLGGSDCAFG